LKIHLDIWSKVLQKTAFSTTQGLFHFTATPFDLANSPSTFVRLIEDVLRGLQWEEFPLNSEVTGIICV
jgi:hypothetical protein